MGENYKNVTFFLLIASMYYSSHTLRLQQKVNIREFIRKQVTPEPRGCCCHFALYVKLLYKLMAIVYTIHLKENVQSQQLLYLLLQYQAPPLHAYSSHLYITHFIYSPKLFYRNWICFNIGPYIKCLNAYLY